MLAHVCLSKLILSRTVRIFALTESGCGMGRGDFIQQRNMNVSRLLFIGIIQNPGLLCMGSLKLNLLDTMPELHITVNRCLTDNDQVRN